MIKCIKTRVALIHRSKFLFNNSLGEILSLYCYIVPFHIQNNASFMTKWKKNSWICLGYIMLRKVVLIMLYILYQITYHYAYALETYISTRHFHFFASQGRLISHIAFSSNNSYFMIFRTLCKYCCNILSDKISPYTLNYNVRICLITYNKM